MLIGRGHLEPGWRLKEDESARDADQARPERTVYVVSGRVGTRDDDGNDIEASAGTVMVLPPSQEGWVIGDDSVEYIEFVDMRPQLATQ